MDKLILCLDNVPSHTALQVKLFLAKIQLAVLEYSPHLPDLAPLYLFLKLKVTLFTNNLTSEQQFKKY
jgi:hypothetical protein